MKTFALRWKLVVAGFVTVGASGIFAQAPAPPQSPQPPPQIQPPTVKPITVTAPVRTNTLVRPAQTASPRPQVGPPIPTPLAPRVVPTPIAAGPTTPPNALVWDKESKEVTAKLGAENAIINFYFTNVSSSDVVIRSVRPSCGCTVVKLPPMPWTIPAGTSSVVEASLDLRGKRGVLSKSLTVDSSSGIKSLIFKVTVDEGGATNQIAVDTDRLRNMQLAMADRQVVFRNNDCAKCHAEPAHGKMGKDLFQAACAVCHDTPHRATMVPDLKVKHPATAYDWKTWISYGRPGSLMPGFAKSEGGPLTDEQINSLVQYLVASVPATPQTTAQVGAQAIGYPTSQPAAQPVAQPVFRPSVPTPLPTTAQPVPKPTVQTTPVAAQPFPKPAVQTPSAPAVKPAAAPSPTAKVDRSLDKLSAFPFPKEK